MARGDREAFAEIFARHRASVYRYARQMSGCPAVADDVVQDVFVALMDAIRRFDPARGALSTYLYGVTRHVVMRHVQRRGERVEVDVEELSTEDQQALSAPCDPFDTIVASDTVERLRVAIVSLPIHQREVVVLCELHERSYEEAAVIVGCPLGTIRSRLSRGRAALAEKMARSDGAPAAVRTGRVAARGCWA